MIKSLDDDRMLCHYLSLSIFIEISGVSLFVVYIYRDKRCAIILDYDRMMFHCLLLSICIEISGLSLLSIEIRDVSLSLTMIEGCVSICCCLYL